MAAVTAAIWFGLPIRARWSSASSFSASSLAAGVRLVEQALARADRVRRLRGDLGRELLRLGHGVVGDAGHQPEVEGLVRTDRAAREDDLLGDVEPHQRRQHLSDAHIGDQAVLDLHHAQLQPRAEMRMSAPSAIGAPPPRQLPWIAATTGIGSRCQSYATR